MEREKQQAILEEARLALSEPRSVAAYETLLGRIDQVMSSPATEVSIRAVAQGTAREVFAALAKVDAAQAHKLLAVGPYWLRADAELLREQIPTDDDGDTTTVDVAGDLMEQLIALRTLAASDASRHKLLPAASEEEVASCRERVSGLLPEQLASLYRVCNGFGLYLEEDRPPGIRLRTLEELPTPTDGRVTFFEIGDESALTLGSEGNALAWFHERADGTRLVARDLATLLCKILLKANLDADGRFTGAGLLGTGP